MAVVARDRRPPRGGSVYGFGRYRGLGDVASDAILGSSWGNAAYQAWQAAVGKLPAGFTMGDPTSNMWGASYYNGVKVIGSGPSYKGDGTTVFDLADNSEAPWSQATADAIQAAANAAYAVFQPIDAIRSSTNPYMVAVLTDPEWLALEGSGQPIVWSSLSAELQDKIKLVPNLYNSLIGNLAALTPAPAPTAPSGPARYLVAGIEFLSDGTVISYNGNPVPAGTMLTPAELNALMTTGALPAGDAGPIATPSSTTTSTTSTPAPSSSTPSSTTPPAPVSAPSPNLPAMVDTFGAGNDMTPSSSGGSGGYFPAAGGSSSAGPAPASPSSSTIPRWALALAGAAALAFVVTQSRPSRRR